VKTVRFPIFAGIIIALIAVLVPMAAERSLHGALVVDRGPNTDPAINARLLAQPIHVVTFDTVGGACALALMFAAIFAIGVCGRRVFATRHCESLRALVALQAVAGIALAFSPVTFNQDTTAYIMYARLFGVYGVNPYHLPLAPPHDPIFAAVVPLWQNPLPGNLYGPLWTLLTSGIAHLQAQASLTTMWITQRILAVVASLATTVGVFRIVRRYAKDKHDALARVSIFAFHPLVILETAVNGHNDMIMTGAAVWAFALLEDAPLAAGLFMGASVACKYVSIVLVPFFLIMLWQAHNRRIRQAVFAAAGIAAVFVASFAPFWFGVRTLWTLPKNQSDVSCSLASVLSDGYLALRSAAITDPVFPGQRHWHILRHATSAMFIDFLLIACWVLLAGILLRTFERTRNRSYPAVALTSFIWVLPYMNPYYLIWLSPFLAEEPRRRRYFSWLLTTALLYYAQSLMGRLEWERTTDIYILSLLLLPLAATFASMWLAPRPRIEVTT
jgi:hypothetical protein